MANIRSNEVIEVYGGTAGTAADAITSSTAKDGTQKLFDATTNAAGVSNGPCTPAEFANQDFKYSHRWKEEDCDYFKHDSLS